MQRKAEDWGWQIANRTRKPSAEDGNALHACRMRIAHIAALEQDRAA